MADLIVLAGTAGVEEAAKNAGHTITFLLLKVEEMHLKNKQI